MTDEHFEELWTIFEDGAYHDIGGFLAEQLNEFSDEVFTRKGVHFYHHDSSVRGHVGRIVSGEEKWW